MVGWVVVVVGVAALANELWLQPRSMARVRHRIAQRGDPGKFDRYLGSWFYRLSRWWGLAAGAVLIALGVLLVTAV